MTALPAPPLFRDRHVAGKALAHALGPLVDHHDAIVLGMPRGGVPVARMVADALGAPLDVIVARKLGVPGLAEVSLGAIAEGWNGIVEDSVRWYLGVPPTVVARIAKREREELQRRVHAYRGGRPLPDIRGKTVILVDDGLATGATLRAAAMALRSKRPSRVIAAVPVALGAHCDDVRAVVDELLTLATPDPFETVSAWYDDFAPVDDAAVVRALGRSSCPESNVSVAGAGVPEERTVSIPVIDADGAATIGADLGMPNELDFAQASGLVILAHGGGSTRHSYRNRYLAGRLRMAGWATLRADLLLEAEADADAERAEVRFDIALLAKRLQAATEWAVREVVIPSAFVIPSVARNRSHPDRGSSLPRRSSADRIVLFGASTGAAAAMITAAALPNAVSGVVSRGGRVDLAGDALRGVRAPSLLIVGGADDATLQLNRAAAKLLKPRPSLTVIRGAGHTFEEPGALGAVGERVVRWLDRERNATSPLQWLRALPSRVGSMSRD